MRGEGLRLLGENQNHGRLQCCLGRCRRQLNVQRNALASPLFPSSSLLPLPPPPSPHWQKPAVSQLRRYTRKGSLGLRPLSCACGGGGVGRGGGKEETRNGSKGRLAQEPTRRVRFWNSQDYFAEKKEACIPETGFSEGLSLRKNIFLHVFLTFSALLDQVMVKWEHLPCFNLVRNTHKK